MQPFSNVPVLLVPPKQNTIQNPALPVFSSLNLPYAKTTTRGRGFTIPF